MRRVRLKGMVRDWERDGVSLIEWDRRTGELGSTWIIYKATEPTSTSLYGRHYALLVVLDSKGFVIAHNFHNTSSHNDSRSFGQQAQAWFEEHVQEGLVTPDGRRIKCA